MVRRDIDGDCRGDQRKVGQGQRGIGVGMGIGKAGDNSDMVCIIYVNTIFVLCKFVSLKV